MQIKGFQKTTFIDYPGKVASLVFTGGCNFRCPYCHNGGLVLTPNKYPTVMKDTVLSHLEKRKNVIEGLVITGGEPTLSDGLEAFVRSVKEIGISVKLDTNGTNPDLLKRLIDENLLDYIAMDIKHAFRAYETIIGVRDFDIDKIKTSVHHIIHSGVGHEFRTTVIKGVHDRAAIDEIARSIEGSNAFVLQQYIKTDGEIMPNTFQTYFMEELEEIMGEIQAKYAIEKCSVRGKY